MENEVAEQSTTMTVERALRMFKQGNGWLRERVNTGSRCACGSCLLCAFRVLEEAACRATHPSPLRGSKYGGSELCRSRRGHVCTSLCHQKSDTHYEPDIKALDIQSLLDGSDKNYWPHTTTLPPDAHVVTTSVYLESLCVELALREQRIKELTAELAPDGQKRVLYSQYIAVAESLEQATTELETAKSISAKRKDILIEVRRLFYEARFAPALEEGCVKSPVSEYVRLLIEHSKKLESELAALRKANEEVWSKALRIVTAKFDVCDTLNAEAAGPLAQVIKEMEASRVK